MFTEPLFETTWRSFYRGCDITDAQGELLGSCDRRRHLDRHYGGRCYEIADEAGTTRLRVTFHGNVVDFGGQRGMPLTVTAADDTIIGSLQREGMKSVFEADGETVGWLAPPSKWFSTGRRFVLFDAQGQERGTITHQAAGLATLVGGCRQRVEVSGVVSKSLRMLVMAAPLAVLLTLQPRGSGSG